jgi:hypothetical protein
LFLAHELFKQRGTHYDVFIGNPIPCDSLLQMQTIAEMTAFVRQKVYELPNM